MFFTSSSRRDDLRAYDRSFDVESHVRTDMPIPPSSTISDADGKRGQGWSWKGALFNLSSIARLGTAAGRYRGKVRLGKMKK